MRCHKNKQAVILNLLIIGERRQYLPAKYFTKLSAKYPRLDIENLLPILLSLVPLTYRYAIIYTSC